MNLSTKSGSRATRKRCRPHHRGEIYLNYVGQFQVPVEQHEPTEEERIAAEKEAERLRRKRESNRKYMKKIREKSKEFAEHERIAEEKSSDSNVCVEQNATSKSIGKK